MAAAVVADGGPTSKPLAAATVMVAVVEGEREARKALPKSDHCVRLAVRANENAQSCDAGCGCGHVRTDAVPEEKRELYAAGPAVAPSVGNSASGRSTSCKGIYGERTAGSKENTPAATSPTRPRHAAFAGGADASRSSPCRLQTLSQHADVSRSGEGGGGLCPPMAASAQPRLASSARLCVSGVVPTSVVVGTDGADDLRGDSALAVTCEQASTAEEATAGSRRTAAGARVSTVVLVGDAGSAASTPPQGSAATTRRTRSSPLQAVSPPESCRTRLEETSCAENGSRGNVPAAASDAPAASTTPSPSSRETRRKQRNDVRKQTESSQLIRAQNGSASPSSPRSEQCSLVGGGESCDGGTACSLPSAKTVVATSKSLPEVAPGDAGRKATGMADPVDTAKTDILDATVSPPSGRRRASSNGEGHRKGSARDVGHPELSACSPPNAPPVNSRQKNRQQRQLELLADSPEFRGASAFPFTSRTRQGGRGTQASRVSLGGVASCVRSPTSGGETRTGDKSGSVSFGPRRVRRCDDRGRSVTGERRRRDCSDGIGIANRSPGSPPGTKGGVVGVPGSSPSGERERRLKKRRRRGEGGSSPSTDDSREGEEVCASNPAGTSVGEGGRSSGEAATGRRESSSALSPRCGGAAGARARAADSPLDYHGAGRVKSTRRSSRYYRADEDLGLAGSAGGSSASLGESGRKKHGRRACTPTAAGRMGLDTTSDASESDDGGGSCCVVDQSSPLSSGSCETIGNIPRLLGPKFVEDNALGLDVAAAADGRRKRGLSSGLRDSDGR